MPCSFNSSQKKKNLKDKNRISDLLISQVIPAILDSDAVSQEEKIRAMRELRTETDDTRLKSVVFVFVFVLLFLFFLLARTINNFLDSKVTRLVPRDPFMP